jgi:serine/threonine protein kinase
MSAGNGVELPPETPIGPYLLKARIGAGGMGEVYAAEDTRVDPKQKVAIKLLFATSADQAMSPAFNREIGILRQIDDSNVIRLFDFGTWQGRPFLVMELLEGRTVRDESLAQRTPLSWHEVRWIAVETCKALTAIHQSRIVHRDVKPQNIFIANTIGGRRLKLLDFGVAKYSQRQDSTVTVGTQFIGTATYAAPEQFMGGELSPATDIYGLGCVLYELLTRQPPFIRPTPEALVVAHAKERPTAPSLLRPGISRSVDRLILKALAKRPADRFGSAAEMAKSIEATFRPDRSRFVIGGALAVMLLGLMMSPFLKQSQRDPVPHLSAAAPSGPPPVPPPTPPAELPPVAAPAAVEKPDLPPHEKGAGSESAFSTAVPPSTPSDGPPTSAAKRMTPPPAANSNPHDPPPVPRHLSKSEAETKLSSDVNKAVKRCKFEVPDADDAGETRIGILVNQLGARVIKLPESPGTFAQCLRRRLQGAVEGVPPSFHIVTIGDNKISISEETSK